MRLTSLRYALLPLVAALLLSACHGKDDASQPGGSTPEAALQGSVDLLQAGDFKGLWKHALPPADYATLRADWAKKQQNPEPISAADRAKFDQTMTKLTEPGAEDKLYAELQPKLVEMQQKYKDQLPVLISVGDALVKNGIAQNKDLTTTQKAQANSVMDVLTPWAQQTPWFDQDKAKQAVGVAVSTARKLDLKKPEQLRSMDFDTAMAKYSTGFAGLKQFLSIYGLSVDDTLKSVKIKTVSNENGHAVVKVDYTLLGKPLTTESKMIEQDGRWYSEDMVKNVRKAHREAGRRGGRTGSQCERAGQRQHGGVERLITAAVRIGGCRTFQARNPPPASARHGGSTWPASCCSRGSAFAATRPSRPPCLSRACRFATSSSATDFPTH